MVAGTSFLALLDDIAAVLDGVAAMAKVAVTVVGACWPKTGCQLDAGSESAQS